MNSGHLEIMIDSSCFNLQDDYPAVLYFAGENIHNTSPLRTFNMPKIFKKIQGVHF